MADMIKKVCICGDPSVGKTSLVRKFVTGKYDDKYISTLGTVVSKKTIRPSNSKDNVTMMLWDVSGQPEFKRIHASAFKNATGALAVCDITRLDTCEHLQEWITSLREYAGDVPVTVLANKFDLSNEVNGNYVATKAMLEDMGVEFYMTSAKTGENVEDAFKKLAKNISNGNPELKGTSPHAKTPLPEKFEKPSELLDYIIIKFCETLGDEEMGMHMIRKRVADSELNINRIKKNELDAMSKHLISIITEFKGKDVASKFNTDLLKAFDRC